MSLLAVIRLISQIKHLPDEADAYICMTFSAQELPDVEQLCILEDFKKPTILFNLKLDTQPGPPRYASSMRVVRFARAKAQLSSTRVEGEPWPRRAPRKGRSKGAIDAGAATSGCPRSPPRTCSG